MTDTDSPPAAGAAAVAEPVTVSEPSPSLPPETPEPLEDAMATETETSRPHAETARETGQETGGAVEAVALISMAAVLAAAFGWSAIALHGLAQAAGITSWLAWGAPVIVDGPIVQATFALVTIERRERFGVMIPPGTRGFFWLELFVAELISLAGNSAHAVMLNQRILSGLAAAAVAGVAPIAALVVTHALTVLLEVPRTPEDNPSRASARQSTEIGAAAAVSGVSPGDGLLSPAVSYPGGGDTPGDVEETSAVSGDAEGDSEETAARDARILALRAEGKSYRAIGAEVGIRHGSVGKILKRLAPDAETDPGDSEPADDTAGPPPEGGESVLHLVR